MLPPHLLTSHHTHTPNLAFSTPSPPDGPKHSNFKRHTEEFVRCSNALFYSFNTNGYPVLNGLGKRVW
jgi:hypothetical protein